MKSLKDKSLAGLIKECDDVFRKYIQKRDEGKPCFICGNPIPKGEAEVCHFIRRQHLLTRFNEFNGHLGCMMCNRSDPDHEIRYSFKLRITYGAEKVYELLSLKRSLMKPTRSDIQEIIDSYKQKIKEL